MYSPALNPNADLIFPGWKNLAGPPLSAVDAGVAVAPPKNNCDTGLYKDQHFTFIGLQTKFEFRKK